MNERSPLNHQPDFTKRQIAWAKIHKERRRRRILRYIFYGAATVAAIDGWAAIPDVPWWIPAALTIAWGSLVWLYTRKDKRQLTAYERDAMNEAEDTNT